MGGAAVARQREQRVGVGGDRGAAGLVGEPLQDEPGERRRERTEVLLAGGVDRGVEHLGLVAQE